MLALSIRQPWASLILRAGKDVENREWPTRVRGRILIHAAKSMTQGEWQSALEFARSDGGAFERELLTGDFEFDRLPRGGLIGTVELVDCVEACGSPWFVGRYGFLLRDPRPLSPLPWRGQLGFFEVPDSALAGG